MLLAGNQIGSIKIRVSRFLYTSFWAETHHETDTRNKKLVFSSFVSPIRLTFYEFRKRETPKLVFYPTYKEWPKLGTKKRYSVDGQESEYFYEILRVSTPVRFGPIGTSKTKNQKVFLLFDKLSVLLPIGKENDVENQNSFSTLKTERRKPKNMLLSRRRKASVENQKRASSYIAAVSIEGYYSLSYSTYKCLLCLKKLA